jgi:cysteine desulfuration protein SufE
MSEINIPSLFAGKSQEAIYQQIMQLGQQLPAFNPDWAIDSNRVSGCQSLMYVHTELKDDKLYFYAHSDALISKGLAALLIYTYEGQEADVFLKSQPLFLKELGILSSLSPTRANGVASLWVKMRQQAIALLSASV